MVKVGTTLRASISVVDEAGAIIRLLPSDIRLQRIQAALEKSGHNPGPFDGVIGRETMAAVKSYQRDKGLATGGITLQTLESLEVKI